MTVSMAFLFHKLENHAKENKNQLPDDLRKLASWDIKGR
jgi:hypothetical protein